MIQKPLNRTEALLRVQQQQLPDKVRRRGVEPFRRAVLRRGHALEGEVLAGGAEGRRAHQHLEQHAAQRPQVRRVADAPARQRLHAEGFLGVKGVKECWGFRVQGLIFANRS